MANQSCTEVSRRRSSLELAYYGIDFRRLLLTWTKGETYKVAHVFHCSATQQYKFSETQGFFFLTTYYYAVYPEVPLSTSFPGFSQF